MKLPIHIAEKWNIFNTDLSHEDRIVGSETKRGNIQIGKMIRTKNIGFLWIKFTAIFYFKWNGDECKEQSCPPAVKDADQVEIPGKKNRDKEQRKKKKEERSKYNNTIAGI